MRNVTPFLWLLDSYSRMLYPEIIDPARRIGKFKKKHSKTIKFAAILDGSILLIFIAVVIASPVAVVLRGIMSMFG
ncbi:hypothetical protein CQ010_05590 [Arthrobacter sp. MYb211]|nr:hypothetical protein CQ015_06285 [Arthrobacter sp. MYb221]PRC08593.1 hypothetical protein CQ010_05590 [Arthrobacter sp. MYb211]